ncbi:C-GCAxxG-C-C family protein [Oscillibacter sp.]|uniref:C-GCAxxG-C-C family protein n=1 Tax=Oscillibacter sp. TaxID=1945593 RepID=UPI0026116025|nr:C-GCAxxG-C-C family protein [Oscillibacter sp.]MDD3346491.1 C-GCAxxG-C-C family protein [Oscillibacter sp.]
MTRRERADAYRKRDFNCAQCVLAAFGDLTGVPEETALSIAGGLGGGVGGTQEELCGALSGALLVLGMLVPHTGENDLAAKRRVYDKAAELRRRFVSRFGCTRCGALLATEPSVADREMAQALGSRRICAVFIVEAVRILEEFLSEEGLCP